MTDHNDTGATARPWREALRREPERYAACSPEAISHGSQAQMKYFVADAQHDIAILATCLAEVERERDEWKQAAGVEAQLRREFLTKANAAEARIAVLEKALRQAELAVSELCVGQHPDNECWNILREVCAALAAEQKEAGK